MFSSPEQVGKALRDTGYIADSIATTTIYLSAKPHKPVLPCNLDQNVSVGVRYLAWLMRRFHNDLRLVAAAYYAGEDTIGRRELAYQNPDVVAYVAAIRTTYLREARMDRESANAAQKRDVG